MYNRPVYKVPLKSGLDITSKMMNMIFIYGVRDLSIFTRHPQTNIKAVKSRFGLDQAKVL